MRPASDAAAAPAAGMPLTGTTNSSSSQFTTPATVTTGGGGGSGTSNLSSHPTLLAERMPSLSFSGSVSSASPLDAMATPLSASPAGGKARKGIKKPTFSLGIDAAAASTPATPSHGSACDKHSPVSAPTRSAAAPAASAGASSPVPTASLVPTLGDPLMGSKATSSASTTTPTTSGGAIPKPKRAGAAKKPSGFNLLGTGSDSPSSSSPAPAAAFSITSTSSTSSLGVPPAPAPSFASAAPTPAPTALVATVAAAAAVPAPGGSVFTTTTTAGMAGMMGSRSMSLGGSHHISNSSFGNSGAGSSSAANSGMSDGKQRAQSSPTEPLPPTVSTGSATVVNKVRRVAKPKMPTMSLGLTSTEGSEVVEMSKVKERDVEHLIVDFSEASMDSPFIATTGQFPGGFEGAAAAAASNPALARYGGASGGALGAAGMMGACSKAAMAGAQMKQQQSQSQKDDETDAVSKPAAAAPTRNRKFFRIDESNLFVFVNDNNDSSAEQSDMMRNAQRGRFTEMGRSGEASSGPGGGIGGIPFEALKFGGILGSGSQGSVYAVSHCGRNYALKKISITDALDRTQANVERQARKNGIVRELQMVANRDEICQYVVNLHNAYFRKDEAEAQQHLYILMERMSMSVEDLKHAAAKLSVEDVRKTAQRCFGDRVAGQPVDGRKVERKHFRSTEYIVGAQRGTPLPDVVLGVIAADAVRGLHFLHSRLRLVHTDLKPANLMLSENVELVKLADFGCSLQMSDENGQVKVSNVILGTKLYMSPERARACFSLEDASSFDEKSDIWALGILLLELAAGCHPCDHFREEYWNFDKMLRWSNMAKPETMAYDFIHFLQRCLNPDPAARASTTELQQHDFIRRFERTNRKNLASFVRQLRTQAAEFERNRMRVQMRDSVKKKATLTADLKRASAEAWSGFEKGVMGFNVPDTSNEDKFPALGSVLKR